MKKTGAMLCCCSSQKKNSKLDTKLERKMTEFRKSFSGNLKFKSMDSIILRFPQLKEGLKTINGVFLRYDKDCNGTIDRQELKNCLEELNLKLSEEEVEDLFRSCDIDGSQGIQFNEFIVLLCLIHLLTRSSGSGFCSKELEATFDTIVEVFLFLDKNGDGKLNKNEMIMAFNQNSPWEKSPAHVTTKRFEEMDWDRNGKVSFREFLFGFIRWVGFEFDGEDDEIPFMGS